MSQDYALSNSAPLERDARLVSGDAKVAPGEIAVAVIIGRTSEFFDFFVYGIASVLVFPQLLFPEFDPLTATLYSFAIFSLAFIARPIGSVIFMQVDRRHGRGVKLTIALFLLGGSTAAMSFLPGYAQIGFVAAGLLAFLRICQGLALAGAWDGLASLLALNAPQKHRGWYAMMPQLGAPLGFLLAAGLFAFFVSNLSNEDFLDWGWRYPFFVAFAINVVALFARLRLVVTDEFTALLERRELRPTPVWRMFRAEGRNVLIGAFAALASFALFHLVTIFPLSWVTLYTGRHAREFLVTEMVGAMVCVVAVIASGAIADRIGRRTLLAICAVLIGLFSFAAPFLLSGGATSEAGFIFLGFALLGLSHGQASGAVTSNFSTQYRYTGAALTSDMSWLLGAAFAPLVALGLSAKFGLAFVGLYLLSGAVCTGVSLLINRRMLDIRD
ncbi:MFS transporter [Hansschlegelia sp.]|uniref:MFS transporter n=1 Tax=Hansschlegelia sp. TaxID=2041892 RepID=UPI002CD6A26D|nr:MFS transporter [Hansschlegelia sp.]HVI29271.1 MFS transporter [Hansschlegelia sp.]